MKEIIARIIFKIHSKIRAGLKLSLLESILWPLMVAAGFIYYSLNYLKWALYTFKILPPFGPSIFCVSVGNIKIGGTGKSPIVIKLAGAFANDGHETAIINRGYLGPVRGLNVISDGERLLKTIEESSDEAFMEALALIGPKDPLARSEKNAAIIKRSGCIVSFGENKITGEKGCAVLTAKQRVDCVKHLEDKGFKGICFLDDAFQYYRLKKNIDIVVLDYGDPFSNGLTFPAGAMRDRLARLEEADVVIISKCPPEKRLREKKVEMIKSICRKYSFTGNFYESGIEIKGLYSIKEEKAVSAKELKSRRAYLISAVADNKSVSAAAGALAKAGGFSYFSEGFIDHAGYREAMQREILRKAASLGADFIITTFKDAVKLRRDIFEEMPLYAILSDAWIENESGLVNEIKKKYETFSAGKSLK
ncbi:MAG: Tetraacyldisaccharide 4'-kinase [bacterium ADurb.Bin243]|nr:MAG: Tetraacyldisaccharide 4'-kinase [bacterium ADurb.Bin243]HOD39240.1 tetraacyldisaccharide 4'-kinase [Candidatus Wallbacteria bacterium]